jgi:hypothetical protein
LELKTAMLEKEREYFDKHRDEFVKHLGKFVLIKDNKLVGVFNTIEEAISEGARRFGLTSFLVREITNAPPQEIDIPALSLGILNANSTRPI